LAPSAVRELRDDRRGQDGLINHHVTLPSNVETKLLGLRLRDVVFDMTEISQRLTLRCAERSAATDRESLREQPAGRRKTLVRLRTLSNRVVASRRADSPDDIRQGFERPLSLVETGDGSDCAYENTARAFSGTRSKRVSFRLSLRRITYSSRRIVEHLLPLSTTLAFSIHERRCASSACAPSRNGGGGPPRRLRLAIGSAEVVRIAPGARVPRAGYGDEFPGCAATPCGPGVRVLRRIVRRVASARALDHWLVDQLRHFVLCNRWS